MAMEIDLHNYYTDLNELPEYGIQNRTVRESCFAHLFHLAGNRNPEVSNYLCQGLRVPEEVEGENITVQRRRNLQTIFRQMRDNPLGRYNINNTMELFNLGGIGNAGGGFSVECFEDIVRGVRTTEMNRLCQISVYPEKCKVRQHNINKQPEHNFSIELFRLKTLRRSLNNYFVKPSHKTTKCEVQGCRKRVKPDDHYWRSVQTPEMLVIGSNNTSYGKVEVPIIYPLPKKAAWIDGDLPWTYILNGVAEATKEEDHTCSALVGSNGYNLTKSVYNNDEAVEEYDLYGNKTTITFTNVDCVVYNKYHP